MRHGNILRYKTLSQKVRKVWWSKVLREFSEFKRDSNNFGEETCKREKQKMKSTYVNVVVASLFGIISYFASVHITIDPVTAEIWHNRKKQKIKNKTVYIQHLRFQNENTTRCNRADKLERKKCKEKGWNSYLVYRVPVFRSWWCPIPLRWFSLCVSKTILHTKHTKIWSD